MANTPPRADGADDQLSRTIFMLTAAGALAFFGAVFFYVLM